ncbi:M3 family oligoendopeptidase [Bacillus gobiensis]|uniref:M3 family oligoendopeptidase n=1 Tax=Bacillus gobiensis TaxID=1441095 RepID=UPI003D1C1642
MTLNNLKETWNLDVFFKGGSHSEEFASYLNMIREELSAFHEQVKSFTSPKHAGDINELSAILSLFESVVKKTRQAGAFVSCLQAQNMKDLKANQKRSEITQLSATFHNSLVLFDKKLSEIDKSLWNELMQQEEIKEISYILNERREKVKDRLSVEQETLIQGLAVDGYHSWGDLYNAIVSKIKIPYEDDGETKMLSVGQASNLTARPERHTRKIITENLNRAWEQDADILSRTLNHLGGFRLNVYGARRWNNVLKEPLEINRMKEETLDVMWEVISDNKQPFVDYLNRKAELLGLDKLDWCDLEAPIGTDAGEYSYDRAANFIVDQFKSFAPKLASFSEKAFKDRWIEAEDRDGKRPGGFCTSFPESEQSRIFMTFSGSASNVSTLAHELGHAYHQEAMLDVRPLNRGYAMNVAETASTFAEMIVADAALKQADSDEQKLVLLEDKLQRSVAFYMNIHARFLFEKRFYEERKKGMVSAERLNQLMVEAQKEAYCDALGDYAPYFWASKLHFYITSVPFYNFPYTFGYLFSLGIYARALKEGARFEEKYIALLKDTASMTVEDLASKHLNVDLTKREFWEDAIELSIKDAEEFLRLT